MFQVLIGIAFLGLITIPVLILILALRQNLLECLKPKAKQKPVKTRSSYKDSDELLPVRLRVIK